MLSHCSMFALYIVFGMFDKEIVGIPAFLVRLSSAGSRKPHGVSPMCTYASIYIYFIALPMPISRK